MFVGQFQRYNFFLSRHHQNLAWNSPWQCNKASAMNWPHKIAYARNGGNVWECLGMYAKFFGEVGGSVTKIVDRYSGKRVRRQRKNLPAPSAVVIFDDSDNGVEIAS